MALGARNRAAMTVDVPRAAKLGPQSRLTDLLRGDVIAETTGLRALQLSTLPKRTRTYFAPYKPGSAQRIPPMADKANPNNVRRTLIARAQLLVAGAGQ